jgi:hypothetical protein
VGGTAEDNFHYHASTEGRPGLKSLAELNDIGPRLLGEERSPTAYDEILKLTAVTSRKKRAP